MLYSTRYRHYHIYFKPVIFKAFLSLDEMAALRDINKFQSKLMSEALSMQAQDAAKHWSV